MDKNRTPQEAREKAQENFKAGYNCAQSVLLVFCSDLGIDENTALRLSQPFGGGMSRMREVCGAVSGMLMSAGLAEGSADAGDKKAKDSVYTLSQHLAGAFREKNGSIVCRELLGLVPMGQSQQALENGTAVTHIVQQPESSARTDAYYKKRPCELLIGDAAEIFQTWLNNRQNTGTEN